MTATIAAIQMCSGTDPVRNVETMRRLVREAAGKGAVYVQTPEMTGALQKDRSGLRAILRQEADDLVAAAAAELAAELSIHLHVGSTAIALADGKVANRGFLFGPDGARIVTRLRSLGVNPNRPSIVSRRVSSAGGVPPAPIIRNVARIDAATSTASRSA